MKIIIGRNWGMKIDKALVIEFPGLLNYYPNEIREKISEMISTYEKLEAERDIKVYVQTLNLTVLDLIRNVDSKNFDPAHHIPYEDVFVWKEKEEKLVPLLEIHPTEYLSHFSLMDLFNCQEL